LMVNNDEDDVFSFMGLLPSKSDEALRICQ